MRLVYQRPDMNHINLTCSARGVFPKPEVSLSWGLRWRAIDILLAFYFFDGGVAFFAIFLLVFFSRRDQRGETTTLTIERDGLFDISVTKILTENLLEPETIFQCFLTIPGTNFDRREETMYFPGKGKFHSKFYSKFPYLVEWWLLLTSIFRVFLTTTLYFAQFHKFSLSLCSVRVLESYGRIRKHGNTIMNVFLKFRLPSKKFEQFSEIQKFLKSLTQIFSSNWSPENHKTEILFCFCFFATYMRLREIWREHLRLISLPRTRFFQFFVKSPLSENILLH